MAMSEREARRLLRLLDTDPAEAVRLADQIEIEADRREEQMGLKASILVDGGNLSRDSLAVGRGLALYRELYSVKPDPEAAYTLANALVGIRPETPIHSEWLADKESSRANRAEARQLYWQVASHGGAGDQLRTMAWTNLANEFSASFRLSEAHDAWYSALSVDPSNGAAALWAAHNLMWLLRKGGCSDMTEMEAIMLFQHADRHRDRVMEMAGAQAVSRIPIFRDDFVAPPPRSRHADPFIAWVEEQRLSLGPVVELIDPSLGKLDWLVLKGVIEQALEQADGRPPPIFAMFNMLKSDFILARDLTWRVVDDQEWPTTGRFSDTLDGATYGPKASALILAHRSALDLLDKIAVLANSYFTLEKSGQVTFHNLWRDPADKDGLRPLREPVTKQINRGINSLYGLAELAEDYGNSKGILRMHKDLRNAGTHRFVVLHEYGEPGDSRHAPEVQHVHCDRFTADVVTALRVARSAIQMLAFAVTQLSEAMEKETDGRAGILHVFDLEDGY